MRPPHNISKTTDLQIKAYVIISLYVQIRCCWVRNAVAFTLHGIVRQSCADNPSCQLHSVCLRCVCTLWIVSVKQHGGNSELSHSLPVHITGAVFDLSADTSCGMQSFYVFWPRGGLLAQLAVLV